MRLKLLATAALAFIGWSVSPAWATAVVPSQTFVQSSDHCTGNCTIDTNNTVTISDVTAGDGLLNVRVSLDTGWYFQPATPGDGHEASFAFSSTQNNLTFPTISAGFTSIGPLAEIKNDGLTHPANAYGFLVDTKQTYSTLSFTIATTLGLDAFINTLIAAIGDVTNPLFSADVYAANGKTGAIDFGYGNPSSVPIPGALWLMGSALLGGTGLAKWRRRRNRIIA